MPLKITKKFLITQVKSILPGKPTVQDITDVLNALITVHKRYGAVVEGTVKDTKFRKLWTAVNTKYNVESPSELDTTKQKQFFKTLSTHWSKMQVEANYEGNLGFHEMYVFYQKANEDQIDLVERLIEMDKATDAWKIIQKVTNMKLTGTQFNGVK